jgi:hypothetical protein
VLAASQPPSLGWAKRDWQVKKVLPPPAERCLEIDPDGYTVSLDGGAGREIAANDTMTISGLDAAKPAR